MRSAWDWDFAFEIFPRLLRGMGVTIAATLVGIVVAVVLGLVLALGRRSDKRWLRLPFRWFIEFVRSTPLLVQLFFLFYALPLIQWIPEPLRVFPAFLTLVIGLGVHYATYASEAYRAGIDSVDKGQWEASTALNLKTITTWRNIILPQAIPRTLPALGNYFVGMFKDAPLGSAIAVICVLAVARSIGSSTFRYVEPMTIAGLLFLLVSIPAAMFVRSLERRTAYDT